LSLKERRGTHHVITSKVHEPFIHCGELKSQLIQSYIGSQLAKRKQQHTYPKKYNCLLM